MTPFVVGAALALLSLDAAPATAPASARTPAASDAKTDAAKTKPADDMDKVICHKEEITGSRFEKRICMTKAEWGEQARRTEEFERRLNQRPDPVQSGGMAGSN
jgi:hypothetical protein